MTDKQVGKMRGFLADYVAELSHENDEIVHLSTELVGSFELDDGSSEQRPIPLRDALVRVLRGRAGDDLIGLGV